MGSGDSRFQAAGGGTKWGQYIFIGRRPRAANAIGRDKYILSPFIG